MNIKISFIKYNIFYKNFVKINYEIALKNFEVLSRDQIYNQRKSKFLKIGRDKGFKPSSETTNKSLGYVESSLSKIFRLTQNKKIILIGVLVALVLAAILMF